MQRSAWIALAVLGVLAALGGLVAAGRWEGRRHARSENRALAEIRALVGPLDQPSLDAFRLDVDFRFDCLLYRRGGNPYALELCFDRRERLVEAIDRRSGEPRIASLREAPADSTISVSRREVDRLLKKLGAPVP